MPFRLDMLGLHARRNAIMEHWHLPNFKVWPSGSAADHEIALKLASRSARVQEHETYMRSTISLRYPGTGHAALCTGLLMRQPSCTMPARNAAASVRTISSGAWSLSYLTCVSQHLFAVCVVAAPGAKEPGVRQAATCHQHKELCCFLTFLEEHARGCPGLHAFSGCHLRALFAMAYRDIKARAASADAATHAMMM